MSQATLCSMRRVGSSRFFAAFSRRFCSAASWSAAAVLSSRISPKTRGIFSELAEDVRLELLDLVCNEVMRSLNAVIVSVASPSRVVAPASSASSLAAFYRH